MTTEPEAPSRATSSSTVRMPTAPAAVSETHSGVVFFFGDRAYKLKKPVDLGFLDFRTREARELDCHREVELNRRLAPDVYLGVSDILGVDGERCEHMVVMRRMPAERRLSTLVTGGAYVDGELRRLAHVLATFHTSALTPPQAAVAAGADALRSRWEDNLRSMTPFAGEVFDPQVLDATGVLARRYLEGRGPLFAQRIAAGHAIDGHGDLLADDIFCLDDGPRVLDCLEFDEALRGGDSLADVASLVMDLERLGRPDLGMAFLARYRELMDDNWPASLAHHHIAYRAHVRAKVGALRAAQGDDTASDEASRLLGLAHRHLEAARVRLVLVGGLPGTGKSTVAAGIAAALGAVLLRSDEVRKANIGHPSTETMSAPFRRGSYTTDRTDTTYEVMLEEAHSLLVAGESVVLDATWLVPGRRRRAAELAERTVADVAELRCVLPAEVAAERIRARAAVGRDVSDADPAVAAAMAATALPWPEARTLDTTQSPAGVLRDALSALGVSDTLPG